jgi:hypothetical protein
MRTRMMNQQNQAPGCHLRREEMGQTRRAGDHLREQCGSFAFPVISDP